MLARDYPIDHTVMVYPSTAKTLVKYGRGKTVARPANYAPEDDHDTRHSNCLKSRCQKLKRPNIKHLLSTGHSFQKHCGVWERVGLW